MSTGSLAFSRSEPGSLAAPRHTSVRGWAFMVTAAAVVVTAVDAVLLERSKGYFRGGFLSIDHLEGPGQTVGFVALSLLVDAGLIAGVLAVVSQALRVTGLTRQARVLAGLLVGAGGLLAYDAVTYQILRFLGDAFDLGLMLDLVDGRVSEILAVLWAQLAGPAVVAIGCLAVAASVVGVTHRLTRHVKTNGREPLALPALLGVAAAAALGSAATRSDVLENGLLRKPAGQAMAALVNAVTDIDRDGFGVVGRASDPDAWDASVYPYAVDVPGNGRDEDGVGGDLPAGTTPYEDGEPVDAAAPWPRTPDVLLVVLESFRADLLGSTFEGKPVTPALDAIGSRGYSSPAAYSHNGYTVQSRFHLFTGTLAGRPGSPTLIDDFKAHGYQVAYFSGQDESFGGPQYDIGFSRVDAHSDARADRDRRYSTSSTPGSLGVPMAVVEKRVADFVGKAAADRPLLLCVNFYDTHFPYTHDGIETITSSTRLARQSIVPGERNRLWATYVNTASNVDRAIGRVLDGLRTARGREPGVIVTSDHGESLLDEGFLGHGYGLNEAQTRVPLVVANLPMVVPEPFVQSELRPALLAAMREPDGARAPRARPRGESRAFQYPGDLGRPRQLAFLGPGGRFIYDFRSGRAKAPSGDWLPPEKLPKPEREQFLDLIRFWERIHLTRHSAWRRTDGDG